jgi:hypothetical protein
VPPFKSVSAKVSAGPTVALVAINELPPPPVAVTNWLVSKVRSEIV